MDKIKTPVRFGLSLLQDANGENLCIMRQASYGSYNLNDVAKQIVEALNTTADQSRVLEVMRTALEHYDDPSIWRIASSASNGYSDWYQPEQVHGFDVARKALAEARRIMEGK